MSAGGFAVSLLTLAALGPASAQGLFERLFGGFHHHRTPAGAQAFADPFTSLFRGPSQSPRQTDSGPANGYCVRTTDGFYFPVQAHAGVSAADICHAFCPASRTRVYSGVGIDQAVASDGSRYADLDTAFLYRKQLVAGSTCNGRDVFGLAHVDVSTDPTLRPGDVVANESGLQVFVGMNDKVASFTPVDTYRGMPRSVRERLSAVKIVPPAPGAPNAVPLALSARSVEGASRSAQLK